MPITEESRIAKAEADYKTMVTAIANYMVTANQNAVWSFLQDDLVFEYNEAVIDFGNYGTDEETARMMLNGALTDACEQAEAIQKNVFSARDIFTEEAFTKSPVDL